MLVAFLGFVRSFAFMKLFDFVELGTITLISTAASLVSLLQLGLINGGYRIIALKENGSDEKVNNVVFTYITILGIIFSFSYVIMVSLNIYDSISIFIIAVVIGICMLVTNWLTNMLIGAQEHRKLNFANLISASASIVCLAFGYYFGLYGALLSLLIQPLLFIVIVFFVYKKAIPRRIDVDIKYIKYILKFGFVPYLSGLFFLLYSQIERWSVNTLIGTEGLGKMYLVFLTITLWSLIPTSINSLFFPKAVKAFAEKRYEALLTIIKKNFLLLICYSLIASSIILILFSSLVEVLFPNHLPYVRLVYVLIPALVFKVLCDPITLFLNSIVKLRAIFYSDLLSIVCYIFSIFLLWRYDMFNIDYVVLSCVIYNFVKFAYLSIVYYFVRKDVVLQF